ncbi:MAG: peroxiredoxin [Cytophagales bacterium]|nr:peroxiredoxin [Cytophagales bacterium]
MLKVGDQLPNISLNDQDGNLVNLQEFKGKNPLVVYFYPKDDTPGCTKEACEFRNENDQFKQYDAKIFGISGDSEKSHQRFIAKHSLNFSLLSDKGRKAEKAFGVPRSLFGLLPGRVTFVADKEGVIQHILNSQTDARRHTHESLKMLKRLAEG